MEQRPRRHRRQLVRRAGADPHGARAAAAPDGDLARRGDDEQLRQLHPRGRRDAGAHVLGALHPRPGRPGGAARSGALRAGLGRPAEPPRALPGNAVAAWPDLAAARPGPRADADRLLHARRLRRLVGAHRVRLHRVLRPARRCPDDRLVGLVRPVGGTGRGLLRRDGGAEHGAAATRDRPLEPRRDARRCDVLPRGRLRARQRLGRRAVLRGAARVLLALASRRRRRPAARRGSDPHLRDGRRLGPSHRRGKARPRRHTGATSTSGRSPGRSRRPSISTATARSRGSRRPRRRRDASSPTTRPTRCRRSAASTAPSASFPPRGREWSRRGRASSIRCCASATS